MGRLNHKTAIVTAAAQGIGRATVEAFVREGAHVIALDINADALKQLHGCETRTLDVCNPDAVLAFAGNLGPVDILFNGVGYVHSGSILECDESAWAQSLEINVTSMYRMMRAFIPGMIQRGSGSIINMSSVASSIKGAPNRFAYGTTKAAIIGLTKATAADFMQQGVRCNAICPGTVDTPSLEERIRASGDYNSARAAFIARQPMGRLGRPEEIAQLAVYLASDESAFTTGTAQVIDGGWSN